MKLLLSSALLALIALTTPSSVSAVTDAAIKTQCMSLSTCYRGGMKNVPCSIKSESCPPCITLPDNCFELDTATLKCTFANAYDCTKYWSGDDGGSSGSKGNSTAVTTAPTNTTSNTNSTTTAPPSDASSSSESGTDMSVVFGIVGAAIGVIAVAIIFLVLVRRSRAGVEDEDEMAATPPAMTKAAAGPSTTTNASSYAPYNQRAGSVPQANPTTPTNRVIQYYQDNAMPSPHGSRGSGGFGQQSQQQQQQKMVRPAAAANAPTFFKANPPSAPAPLARAVAPPPPQQQDQYSYYSQAPTANSASTGYPAAEPLFTVHTGAEDPQVARRVSSPRQRRESYEF